MATKNTKKTDTAAKAAEVVEAVETAAVEAVETVEAAPAAEKPKKKAAAKKTAEKPAAPKAARAKKAAAISTKVVVELMDKSADSATLVERAKEDWTAKGNALEDVKELALYINATEGMVYYVVNDDYLSGSFAF